MHVFSMVVGTIWESLKLVPIFVKGPTVDSGGEGWLAFLKNKYLGHQTP